MVKTKPIKKETKKDRFIRLATSRVQKILKYITLLGNCSSNNYEYNENQVNEMFLAIESHLAIIQQKFFNTKEQKEKTQFKFT